MRRTLDDMILFVLVMGLAVFGVYWTYFVWTLIR